MFISLQPTQLFEIYMRATLKEMRKSHYFAISVAHTYVRILISVCPEEDLKMIEIIKH